MWSAKKEHKIEKNLNSEKKGLWLQAQHLFRSISKTDERFFFSKLEHFYMNPVHKSMTLASA